jgi:exodeoxyribonuclease VII large subunit
MLRALASLRERAEDLDVVAIVRGGGARTDLAWFDDLDVALAVAHFPVKVITGIGHTRDVSVLDLITHSEKTPTAAAQSLVARVRATCDRLEQCWAELAAKVPLALRAGERSVSVAAARLVRGVGGGLERSRLLLSERRARLAGVVQLGCQHLRTDARRRGVRLGSLVRARLREAARDLARLRARVSAERMARPLARLAARLDELGRRRALLDPARLLARGYAMVLRAGRLLKRAGDAVPGDEVVVRLQDGQVHATIASVKLAQEGDADGGEQPRVP